MQKFLLPVKLFAIASVAIIILSSTYAQNPVSNNRKQGWYRMHLGQFEITTLADGTLELPIDDFFTEINSDRARLRFSRMNLLHTVQLTVNAFLVNTGSKLILIDAGIGTSQRYGTKLGHLLANLEASGYSSEQVDEIYITHMHTDHIGGLIRNGRPSFANATVRADEHEADFYLVPSKTNSATADEKEDIDSAKSIFKSYITANKFKPFAGKTELVPGITAIPTPGHTSGHTLYVIASQGEKMVVWGDLLHVAALQFPMPSATLKTDWDTKQSVQQRLINFADAANNGYYVAATHIEFPGIGKLRTTGGEFTWIPINHIFYK